MDNNCIFCKIINGGIPSQKVYEDDYFLAIMDISPANKGHVILLTKKHITDIFELEEDSDRIMPVVVKLAKAVKEATKCEGINILQNNKAAAGQTVFHYHMHIIPRYEHDEVNISWSNLKYDQGQMENYATLISNNIKHLDK